MFSCKFLLPGLDGSYRVDPYGRRKVTVDNKLTTAGGIYQKPFPHGPSCTNVSCSSDLQTCELARKHYQNFHEGEIKVAEMKAYVFSLKVWSRKKSSRLEHVCVSNTGSPTCIPIVSPSRECQILRFGRFYTLDDVLAELFIVVVGVETFS